jgi:hypothetical protein
MNCRFLLAACSLFVAAPAMAINLETSWFKGASFTTATHLIDLRQGSYLSRTAASLRGGGYELASGTPVDMQRWYDTKWVDVGATWMTQLTDNVGFIYGLSTGEQAQKYTIAPSMKLGLVMQMQPAKNMVVSLRATTILGGALNEKSCTADYGDIGGVHRVNCRLAASTLAPEETLNYLIRQQPLYRNEVSVSFQWKF